MALTVLSRDQENVVGNERVRSFTAVYSSAGSCETGLAHITSADLQSLSGSQDMVANVVLNSNDGTEGTAPGELYVDGLGIATYRFWAWGR